MKLNGKYLYIVITVIHIAIAVYGFNAFFSNPGKIMFCNSGDGLKNYFALQTFVQDSTGADGFFKFNRFQYPYGDYVYATDNTPGFAIALKWYCHNVKDISAYAILLFNIFVIINFVVCGPMVFYIFRNLLRNDLFAFLTALILPWINIQLPRVWNGHFNLSFFSLTLFALCLLIAWYKNREHNIRLWLLNLLSVAFCLYAFLQHGYFIAIITIFISATLFAYGILQRKEPFGKTAIISSIFIPVLTLGIALMLLHATDAYLSLRPHGTEGYDYHETKTRIANFFTPYYLHHFFFPIRSVLDGNHEHAAYLGNISLYGLTLIGLLMIYKPAYRARFKEIQIGFFSNKFRLAMVIAALLMLSISLGEVYYTGPNGFLIYNFLNPFLYIHKFTEYVEQFRALSRFNWPFFLVFNVWSIYTILQFYKQHGKKVQRVILFLFILIGYVEVQDFINELRDNGADQNVLYKPAIDKELAPLKINPAKYQAILPIPYYNAGTEDYRYIIDDYELWSLFTYRLSLYTGLPLMSARMSRTPTPFVKAILDLAAFDQMDTSLNRLMNNKPVLIVTNKTYVHDKLIEPSDDTAKIYYTKINEFIDRHHLQPIDSLYYDVFFYEWYPKP